MSYMFGLGRGFLPVRAQKIAQKHQATLVNHTDAQCLCGYGCRPHTCPRARRHWFETDNYGEPFNSNTARAVIADLRQAGLGETLEADDK